jgi:DNA-binding response OmpR family regulator
MIGRVLKSEDYNVVFAGTGREAVSQFLAGPPDLVLLDLNMPDKDGWEAWQLMNTLHPMVPVIVITARPHQYGQALRMRVDALMEKPLDLPVLLHTMGTLLAEPDEKRVSRMSDPRFRTALLSSALRPDNGTRG